MSVAIIGGLDRLKRSYERECRNRGFDARVFSQRIPKMGPTYGWGQTNTNFYRYGGSSHGY